MSVVDSVSVYHLAINEQGQVAQVGDKFFDRESYSRMKHGVMSDTMAFAGELALTLCNHAPDIVYGDPPAFVVAYESLCQAPIKLNTLSRSNSSTM